MHRTGIGADRGSAKPARGAQTPLRLAMPFGRETIFSRRKSEVCLVV